MRQYETLDEAFIELLCPEMEETEGIITIEGVKYIMTGKTLPVKPPVNAGLDLEPTNLYRIYIEKVRKDGQ